MNALDFSVVATLLPETTATLFVAYSGGVDSHVLLHLCAKEALFKDRVVAVHVHHGLQEEADSWSEHCRYIAEELGVGFCELRVDGRPKKRQSPEEAARIARYHALEKLVRENDVLLVAQHSEDQLETVLLQLFRGGGLAGLAGMPERYPFGLGLMLRPLLACDKKRILHYAETHRLKWVEDPSNQSVDYDRNYLRNNIIPLLKQRWSAVAKTVSRSARHCAEAGELLTVIAADILKGSCDPVDRSLSIEELLAQDLGFRKLLLRKWFELNGLKSPGEQLLLTIFRDVVDARVDADPELHCQEHLIKRYKGRLYCVPVNSLLQDETQPWPAQSNIIQLVNGFRLQRKLAATGIPTRVWMHSEVEIRFRTGGETIELAGRAGRHHLKKLFQEASVPPWLRKIVPLIYLNGRLAAVAGFWVAADFYCAEGESCFQVVWERGE